MAPSTRWEGPRRGSRLDAVSGLRALGALAVVVYHIASALDLQGTHHRGAWVGQLGRLGVGLFFVLSGFLLYRPYAAAHLEGRKQPNTGVYLVRRALRILPAYWVALTVWLIFYRQPEVDTIAEYIKLYSLTQIYQKGLGLKGLYVAWTLAIEVGFYLALPILAKVPRLVAGRTASPRQRISAELTVAGAWMVIGILYRLILVHQLNPIDAEFYSGWPLGAFDRFGAGMLVAILVVWWERLDITPRAIAFVQRMPWVTWLAALGVMAVVVSGSTERKLGGPMVSPDVQRDVLLALVGFLLAFPAMVSRPGQSRLVRVLGGIPLEPLGVISYGVFLWHPIWIRFFIKFIDEQGYVPTFWPVAAGVIAASIATAIVSYLLLERWALSSASSTPAAPAAAALAGVGDSAGGPIEPASSATSEAAAGSRTAPPRS